MINNIFCRKTESFCKPFKMEASLLGAPDLSFYIFQRQILDGDPAVWGERARGGTRRGKGGPGTVYISCLLTWLYGQAPNRMQRKEQVVLFCLSLDPVQRTVSLLSFFLNNSPLSRTFPLFKPELSKAECNVFSSSCVCHYLSLKL